jgi:zinc transport system permease protein
MNYLELFAYPVLAALALAAISGPIGCFVNWRRMAFYSDTLSHAALLGVGLGLMLGLGAMGGVLGVTMLATLILMVLQRQQAIAPDTLLAILAQASLAGGILLIYTQPQLQINLYGFLFGDVLAIGKEEVVMIVGLGVAVLVLLILFWRPLLLVTMHEELAQAEGIPVGRFHLLLMLMMAVTVAIGIYVAGVMMVSSLLVIPSASARAFSRTPVGMVIGAGILGVAAVVAGLAASFMLDLPPGPAIVLASAAIFTLSLLSDMVRRKPASASVSSQ